MECETPFVLSLMGRAELRDPEGQVVPFPTRKALLLLAMLALSAGETHRREDIASAVWEGGDGKNAREGLRTALATIRKRLPEAAIAADRDYVWLREGFVIVPEEPDYPGDFMPGFETDWAIDQRLRLRSQRVEQLLNLARKAESPSAALAFAESACQIDPLDAEAAATRVELLNAVGKPGDAQVVREAYRSRAIREFGTVSDFPVAPPIEHPLIAAAEWTLARDPDEACALLAGTQSQWFTLSVDRALTIHQRVLAECQRPSRERRLVEGGHFALLTLNGKAGDHLQGINQAYRSAVAEGERTLAARLGEAAAYTNLSKGDFPAAREWAEEGLRFATTGNDPLVVHAAEQTLGIIELHLGDLDSYNHRIEKSHARTEKLSTPYLVVSGQLSFAGSLIERGEIDRGIQLLENCRRDNLSLQSERIEPWLLLLEARIYELTGDLHRAYSVLQRMKEKAAGAGQSAIATVDDSLLRVNCQLQEYDRAAEALARGTLYRRGLGTVPSLHERNQMAPALHKIQERLSPIDLRAAFRRAAQPTAIF